MLKSSILVSKGKHNSSPIGPSIRTHCLVPHALYLQKTWLLLTLSHTTAGLFPRVHPSMSRQNEQSCLERSRRITKRKRPHYISSETIPPSITHTMMSKKCRGWDRVKLLLLKWSSRPYSARH